MSREPIFPSVPDVPDDQRVTGPAVQRYEDIAQDGRILLLGLPHALGGIGFRLLFARDPQWTALMRTGITPVLARLVLEGDETSSKVATPITGTATSQLAHTLDDKGEIDKLLMQLWVELEGVSGRMVGPAPADAGHSVPRGRVYAEHVFTRLFADPANRRVRSLPDRDPSVPPVQQAWTPPPQITQVPAGAELLDPEPVLDCAPVTFGLDHTDSNQHINSLVYPRLFFDAALRRAAAHGESTAKLARFAEVAYRKPCFAGDSMAIAVQCYRDGDVLGAVGRFEPHQGAGPPERAHAFLHVRFR